MHGLGNLRPRVERQEGFAEETRTWDDPGVSRLPRSEDLPRLSHRRAIVRRIFRWEVRRSSERSIRTTGQPHCTSLGGWPSVLLAAGGAAAEKGPIWRGPTVRQPRRRPEPAAHGARVASLLLALVRTPCLRPQPRSKDGACRPSGSVRSPPTFTITEPADDLCVTRRGREVSAGPWALVARGRGGRAPRAKRTRPR